MNKQNNDLQSIQSPDIDLVLSDGHAGRRRIYRALAALLLLGAAVLALLVWNGRRDGDGVQFVTQPVSRGDLLVKVTATGNLEPTNQVDVGMEVSGTIESVAVDYNDQVTAGQVLARLDTDQLAARVRQAEASLALARAAVKEAEATLVEARNHSTRFQALKQKGLCSAEDCEGAQAAYTRAEAALDRSRAQVAQAQAQLDADRTSLDKAVIRSPINGVVLQAHVEPGQTVAASLQTPVLFTLAEDLCADGPAGRCRRGRCGSGEGRAVGDASPSMPIPTGPSPREFTRCATPPKRLTASSATKRC